MAGGSLYTGEIVGTFQPGSVMPVEVTISTHHMGHIEFFLCDKGSLSSPQGPITQTCLNQHKLHVVKNPEDANSFVDPNYPNRFFFPPACADGYTDASPWSSSAWVYPALVQLPHELSCEHCVLQFYYVTANTCLPRGYRDTPWPSTFTNCDRGWYSPQLDDCDGSRVYPEEFWNCADIAIKSDATDGSATATTTQDLPAATTTITTLPVTQMTTTSSPVDGLQTTQSPSDPGNCDFSVSTTCWGTGCVVQISVNNWVPGQLVTLRFSDGGYVDSSPWNCNILQVVGQETTLQLESYNSDNFGFLLLDSVVLPEFICG